MKKIYWALGAVVIIAIAVLLFKPEATIVQVITVQKGEIIQTVTDTALVRAIDTHDLFAPATSGTIVKLPVETGQTVEHGEVILRLENTALNKQIDAAQTRLLQSNALISALTTAIERTQLQLDDAQKNADRQQQLLATGAVTKVELQQAQLLVDTHRLTLNEQQENLNSHIAQQNGLTQLLSQLATDRQRLLITSPADGVVLDRPVKTGQVLTPGTLIVVIAAPGQLEIKADILSDDLAGIEVGQKATVTAPILGEKILTGAVTEIYPQAHEKTSALGVVQRRIPVIIALTDYTNLKPGFEVRVAIETLRLPDVLVISCPAVRTTADGRQQVMVVVDNQVQHRFIETGISDGDNIAVLSGLSAGEQVVLDGGMDLAEGAKVSWE
ncbi:MAG: efflux RND transporter periplasmic adaptor subunit [Desulfotomaculum sp.]|nr:efflux RND transporter periplasmic adaptor subunit [Desulfotomaculum sp.]